MTRPSRITVNGGDNSWEAQLNTNLQQLYDRPLPLFVHAGDLASLEAARPAAQFDQCLAWVDYDGDATPGKHPAFSNGTAWKLLSDWEVNRRVFRSTGSSGNILITDDVVISTGASNITLTLPAITNANEGRIVRAKRQGSGTYTLDTTGADTIDGAADFALGNVDDSFEFVSDGTSEWLVFSGSGAGGSAFLGLADTPGSYAGQALELARVNAAEDALEFVPHLFASIGDTPANFSGSAGLLVRVNTAENALEYVAPAGGIAGNTIFAIAIGTETDVITTGTAKVTFRMPGTFSLDAVRCSLTTASATGTVTVDINVAGSTILTTKLTIDATEETSQTAATPHVQTSDPVAIGDDAEITIDIDDAGSSADATGLKVYFEGQANPADFLDLGDSPSTYASGDALKLVRVNAAEDAVEFSSSAVLSELIVLPPSGTTGITTTVHADDTDDWAMRIQSLHASYTGPHLIIRAARVANSAFKFIECLSEDTTEQFSVRGDGLITAREGISCTPGGSIIGVDIAGGSGNNNVLLLTDLANTTYTGTVELLRVDRTGSTAFNFLSTQSDVGTTPNNRHILRGDGAIFSDVAAATPADYSEMFECVEPRGYPMGFAVQLADGADATKVEPATDVDEIVGFTSANPGIIADMAWNHWHKKYERTEFGAYAKDADGERTLNPAWDPELEYVSREDRDEWMAIGMLGKIWVRSEDQGVLPGQRVTLSDRGILRLLTAQEKTDKRRSWRVLEVGEWNARSSILPIRILFN